MSSVLEKELTCSICTDLLYDPVTFLDCLHANCGACAKAWFTSLNTNAALAQASSSSPLPPVKYTCPICRGEVRATKHNSQYQTLIDNFISENPDKDRTDDEKAALRKLYSPGGGVLPGEASKNVNYSPVRRTPTRRPVPSGSRRPVPAPPAAASSSSSSSSSSSAGAGANQLHNWFLEALVLSDEISCFHCQKRLDFSLCSRCTDCDIITCVQCYRSDKGCRTPTPGQRHTRTLQKIQLEPTRHVQTGIFCGVCESWCDNARLESGGNSYFWSCKICNNGHWEVCMPCASRGNCCPHELELYTNTRGPVRDAAVRGNTDVVRARAGGGQLSAIGYARWQNFNVTCDSCIERIPTEHSYMHCKECRNGQWDICMQCWTAAAEAAGEEGDDALCSDGHKMVLLTQNGKPGTHKVVLDVPHEPPEWIVKTPVVGGPWNGMTAARTAVAIKAHWPEQNGRDPTVYRRETPGERQWDHGGLLMFPIAAEISDVWLAFTEGEGVELVEYLWGWYAGAGGLFPRDCVRFTY